MANISDDFIDGLPFKVELSNTVMKTFDLETSDEKDYLGVVKDAKEFLNSHTPGYVSDVMIIDSKGIELGRALRAVIVRIINIAHRGRYNITLNEEVIYVAKGYRNQNQEEYGRFIRLSILNYKDKTKSKVMRQLKGDVRLIVSDMTKTVPV